MKRISSKRNNPTDGLSSEGTSFRWNMWGRRASSHRNIAEWKAIVLERNIWRLRRDQV